jgi:hypothetical protein
MTTKLKGEGSCGGWGGRRSTHTHFLSQNTKAKKLVQKFFISSSRRRRRRRRIKL